VSRERSRNRLHGVTQSLCVGEEKKIKNNFFSYCFLPFETRRITAPAGESDTSETEANRDRGEDVLVRTERTLGHRIF
jgi:hypothetical protein